MNIRIPIRYIVALIAAVASSAAASASSTSFAIDPQAQKVLSQMQSAYTALNSLSEQITAQESPNLPHSIVLHTTIRMLRPGYVSMTSDSKSSRSGASEVVTDGSHCYVTAPQYPSRYLKFPVPASSDAFEAALSEGITSSMTLALFSNSSAVSSMFNIKRIATLQSAKSVRLGGNLNRVIVATDTDGVTLTLFIDESSHLLHRVIAVDPNKPGSFTETYTLIEPNAALATSNFSFSPPPNTLPFYGTSFSQAEQGSPDQ